MGGGGARRGVQAQGQVVRFSRHTQKPRSAVWALDWVGVRGGQGGRAHLSQTKEGHPRRRGGSPAFAQYPTTQALQSVSIQGIRRPREPRKRGAAVWGEGQRRRGPVPPEPESPGDHSIWGCPGGKEGERPCLPGAGLVQGRVRPALQKPEGNRGPRASLPHKGLWPREWLDFLGFPADLVIVVNADGDKKEAAGQEQQDPQGHEPRLSQRGSDHCRRKTGKGQGSEEGRASPPNTR